MTEIDEVVDAEVLPAVRDQNAVNLFGDASPTTVVERATEAANALAGVIESKKLYKVINNKKFVFVEGWTLLGSMLGVFPVVEWSRQTEDGWEARVVARTRNGDEIGAAEAMCSRRETKWKSADDYAVRSMAQTRAVSKALRHPLGFVMTLAGYEATPEAEMPAGGFDDSPYGGGEPERIENKPLAKPKSWKQLDAMLAEYGDSGWTTDVFHRYGAAARTLLYGDEAELTKEQKDTLWQVAVGAAMALRETVDVSKFPSPTAEEIGTAWSSGLDGRELATPELPAREGTTEGGQGET